MEITKETKPIKELTDSEIEKIFRLTQPYYFDSSSIVERELKHNNTIYLLKDQTDIILAFFMVAWEKSNIQSKERDIVYLGLSCANQSFREKKMASWVYYYFTVDAFNYEQENDKKLILYGTTATPVVLLLLSKIWDNVKPDLEGNFNPDDKEIIEDIKKSVGLDKFSTEHPFVLKGIACNTTYAETEKEKLKEVEKKNNLKLFEKLNIDEANGDRLLIMCNVPPKLKLDFIESKLFGNNL